MHGRESRGLGHLLEELASSLRLENNLEWENSLHSGCNTVDQEMGEVGCSVDDQVCRRACNGEYSLRAEEVPGSCSLE